MEKSGLNHAPSLLPQGKSPAIRLIGGCSNMFQGQQLFYRIIIGVLRRWYHTLFPITTLKLLLTVIITSGAFRYISMLFMTIDMN